jgi:ABC-type lipoprotein export system ATPase subunit
MASAPAGNGGVPKIQVVNGDGDFQAESVERFVADVKLADSKAAYQVIAIMGPQSSGKSTLMNHVVSSCSL